MELSGQYEPLEQIGGDGVQTFRARQKVTGRAVLLHKLGKPADPDHEVRLLKLMVGYLLKVVPDNPKEFLEFGEWEGACCLVTSDSLRSQRLAGWLASELKVLGGGVPQAPMPQPNAGSPPQRRPPVTPKPPAPAPGSAGELTSLFRDPQRGNSPRSEPPLSADAGKTSELHPGEFTSVFGASAGSKPTAQPAPPSPPPLAGGGSVPGGSTQGGEFTRLFHSPELGRTPPGADLPGVPGSAPSKEGAPGEFTGFFQAPSREAVIPRPSKTISDFSRLFGAGSPPRSDSPRPAPGASGPSVGATGLFQTPDTPVPAAADPVLPAGPSEFTRIIRTSQPGGAEASAPVPAPAAVPVSDSAVPRSRFSPLLLVLIGLGMLALILVLIVVLRR